MGSEVTADRVAAVTRQIVKKALVSGTLGFVSISKIGYHGTMLSTQGL